MLPTARVTQIASLEDAVEPRVDTRRSSADYRSDDDRQGAYSGGIGTSPAAGVAANSPRAPAAAARAERAPEPEPTQQQQQQEQPAAPSTEEETEPPIEAVVKKAVIHANKPIEHLPHIAPAELKLIGRCVTFRGETTVEGETRSFFYEGLVATINKETVMLIHVHRYTEEDFQLHKLQIRRNNNTQDSTGKGQNMDTMEGGAGGGSNNGAEGGLNTGDESPATTREEREAHQRSVENASDGGSNRGNGNDFDFDHGAGMAGTQAMEEPQLLNDFGETHAEATTRVRNRMRGHTGSMGPVPYITFSRSHIHRVEFGADPRSSFYSIFQDPTKLYFDMQCLRMFVRRYLIHTSQGNNPRLVPLRAFITCRCNCPNLDNDLLIQTTREELAHLIKIDRDVKRAKKKKEQGRRNVLRSYRPPNGVFRNTGVLYLTHLPRQTFTIGVMELFVILFVLVYEIITGASVELSIIAPYVMKIYPYVFATIAVSVMATGCTLLHAVRMSIPLQNQLYLVAIRGLFTFGSVACAIMTMIVSGEMANLNRWARFYERELPQERLCYFYKSHNCGGVFQSCVTHFNSSVCQCAAFTSPEAYYPYTCDAQIVAYIQRTTIPLVCLTFLIFVTYLFDGYLHLRLFHVARLLERRM